jgi:hypothetical protein
VQITLGWIMIVFGGCLYIAQVISSLNFPFAQRLGIQENTETSDPLLQRAERYTAYWDLFVLGWLPAAGILMVINHPWWPAISLIGGAVYLDTAGREAVKNLSFQHEGIKVGTVNERRVFFGSYIVMAVIAIVVIVYSAFPLFYLL